MIIKPLGNEVAIDTANNVGNANLIRVINVAAPTVMTLQYANGLNYATITIQNNSPVIVQKRSGDLVTGTGLKAAPVAYKG